MLPPATFVSIPMLPDPDKTTVPNLCAFLGYLATRKEPWREKSVLFNLVLAIYLLCPIGTVLTNLDPIHFVVGGLSPMLLVEIPASILNTFIVVMPLLVAYELFRDEDSMRELLVALVVAGIAYSIPMLIEIRLSPQINVWIYGFFQHSFDQMMRYGGYRPIVFMQHGLWVAFFAFMTAFAAVTLLRHQPERRQINFFICLYLIVVLVLCKSANAIVHIVLFAPMVLFLSPKIQVRIAAVIGAIVLVYPALRGAGFIPTAAISDFANSIDSTRASSLIFRMTNEDTLLAHANRRPWFGWGGWGRSLLHDPVTGEMISVIDGRWIVQLGGSGWFGYVGEMGLLVLPLFLLSIRAGKTTSSYKYAAGLALILTANLVDLIPNATLIPFTWLMAGALLGRARSLSHASDTVVPDPASHALAAPWARRQPVV
nr:hypothetical protein [uncultured Devosia sp.]